MLRVPVPLRVAAWGTAVLGHRVPLAQMPDAPGLNADLLRWRDAGVPALRCALPVAGDPAGIAGPDLLTAAIASGGAVVLEGAWPASSDRSVALVPESSADAGLTWRHYPCPRRPPETADLAQHRRALAEAMIGIGDSLRELDVAAWPSDRADALADLQESELPDDALPPSSPPAAWSMLTTALRLREVAALALLDDGRALHADAAQRRRALIRELDNVARRAAMAAANVQDIASR